MKYPDFLDLKYKPSKKDLICLFKITPSKKFTMQECASRVASESSNGTWTDLPVEEHIRRLSAKVYKIKNNYVYIAYPQELFEKGNMPQIWSSIAGNIFGMKAVDGLRLEDIRWPKELIKSFEGPQYGIDGIRKLLKIKKRPLTASVPKPKVGYTPEEFAEKGYELWTGGIDLVKDDENLSSQKFNKFEKRLELSIKMRDRAEKETGERKSHLINITAETEEMKRRAKLVSDYGNEYVMIDILTAGWAGFQTARNYCKDLKLAIHAHRAFHSAFDRNENHGVSMKVIAGITRMIGADQLHIGGLGKLAGDEEEVKNNWIKASAEKNEEQKEMLEQDWHGKKDVLSVCSGGLHPGILKPLTDLLGKDIVLQAGGGILGHKNGTKAGATAMRQAIDALTDNISLREYAKTHSELRTALEQWGEKAYE